MLNLDGALEVRPVETFSLFVSAWHECSGYIAEVGSFISYGADRLAYPRPRIDTVPTSNFRGFRAQFDVDGLWMDCRMPVNGLLHSKRQSVQTRHWLI